MRRLPGGECGIGRGGRLLLFPFFAIWLHFQLVTAAAQARPYPPFAGRNLAPGLENESSVSDARASVAQGNADEGQVDDPEGILNLDIEQLAKTDVVVPSMDIEVTSVAKQESTVGRSPAAIFVITSEMIRRSGATCVPELFRTVPGVEVARVNSHAWAITVRGFNAAFANKLLVLIDGRTVYNTVNSGVFWDEQDLLLEDIERIEVIRGPGGTLWGANAVNGVINVITKSAKDTQGALVTADGGSLDKVIDGVRVGGNNGQGFCWRIYGKHFERGPEYWPGGSHDDWRVGRGGFRLDWELDRWGCNTLTVLGNYYGGQLGQRSPVPMPVPPYTRDVIEDQGVSGANVLARWAHVFDDESDWTLQMYFDRTFRHQVAFKEQFNTLDIEFQHRFPLTSRHELIWGLNYRLIHDYLPTEGFAMTVSPHERTTNLFSGFLQDEITVAPDRLFFTIGTKLEHNSYSGFECQPSARLLWTPDRRHSAWAAISRAVRTPSRVEQDMVMNMGPIAMVPFPTFARLIGSRDTDAEDLMAYEIGYRAQATERFAWDVTAFYNVYEDVLRMEPGAPFVENTYLVVPATFSNFYRAQTYGVELTGQCTLSDRWRVSASYGFLKFHLWPYSGHDADPFDPFGGSSPQNQARFYSSWDLGRSWELDLGVRYVDNLPSQGVPAYITMDVRLGWVPSENFEVALVGQNLLDNHHPEFELDMMGFQTRELRRTVCANVTWRY